MGKTSLATNILRRLAGAGRPVMFQSYEMPWRQIVDRPWAAETGLAMRQVRDAVDEPTRLRMLDGAAALSGLPISIADADHTMPQLAASIRLDVRRRGTRVVFVDYLQLIPGGQRFAVREQEVSHCSRHLKALAKSLGIVIVALCQLNRDVEKRESKEPQLSDLRESGAIEQDADQVWLLSRPGRDSQQVLDNSGLLKIAKKRNGPCGRCELRWDARSVAYTDREDIVTDAFE